MLPIRVTATLRDTEAVVGCALPIAVTLESAAGLRELVDVQAVGADSPFEYEFHSAEHGVFVVSKVAYEQALYIHPPPPSIPPKQALRPGESATFEDDIAGWFVSPLPAGDYTLVVRWIPPNEAPIASPPLAVRFVAPRPTAVATAVDQSGQYLLTAFAHGDASGASRLFLRTSAYGKPTLGRGLEWHRTDASLPIADIAIATEVDEAVGWRWMAWLEGGAFRAAITWGNELLALTPPSPHGLAEARLLPSGFQLADASGLFVLLGKSQGLAVAHVIQLPKGSPPRHYPFALGPTMPEAAAVGMWQHAPGVLEIVRADSSGQSGVATTISTQRIDFANAAAAGRAGPIAHLATVMGKLLALEVAPLLSATPVFDALVDARTSERPRGLDYLRGPLAAGAAGGSPAIWRLDAPDSGAVDGWSIARIPHPEAPVLAKMGNALWEARAEGASSWSRVAQSAHGISKASVVHVAVPDGTVPTWLFATWFDGQYGYSVAPLPEGGLY